MQKKGNGGSFVNIASTAGIRPRPGLTWYNSSKAAVINATKTMAVEFAKDNIRFNNICPVVGLGTGLTDFFLGKPENQSAFIATVPLGRGSTPKDVANACAFLCSEEASFLTGIDLPVDGGRCV
jgi:NAD(P)-dependent dehydrogenase (short-subunit alcohol dehydrogenase family)